MNPGPPPCKGGCKGNEGDDSKGRVNYAAVRPPVDNSLVEGFKEWLRDRVSEDTADYYASVVKRGEWPPNKGKHVKAWRQYAHYLFSIGALRWEQYQSYLFFLKTPAPSRRRATEAVPVDTILKYREILETASLGEVYVLLLGGTRLSHIYRMLTNWEPEEAVEHPTGELEQRLHCGDGYCRYYLGIKEGSKRCDYVYFPVTEPEPPDMTYRQLKDKLRKLGVQAKLFRKFASQRLEHLAFKNNIRVDAVNLIMSRELSVTGAHYLVTRTWADRLFSIYTKWLQEVGLVGD